MSRFLDPIPDEKRPPKGHAQTSMAFPPLEKVPPTTKKRRRLTKNVSNCLYCFSLENNSRIYSSFHPSGFFPETYGSFQDLRYSKGRNQFDLSLKLEEVHQKHRAKQMKEELEKKALLEDLKELKRPSTALHKTTRKVPSMGSCYPRTSSSKPMHSKTVSTELQNPIANPLNMFINSSYKRAPTQRFGCKVLNDFEVFPLKCCVSKEGAVTSNEPHIKCSLSFL
ncbi:unnamed protein product [Phytomonas sp. EM1]|nr:unnamed protein product [Phytomonas sp. EM1]|eukprot:CCW62552.1 unnamed protein product [Phytomonas sp. isolate EM1]